MSFELFPKVQKDFFGYKNTPEKEQNHDKSAIIDKAPASIIPSESTIKCYVTISSGQRNIPYRIKDLLSGEMDKYFKSQTTDFKKPSVYFSSHYAIFAVDGNLSERELVFEAGRNVCGKNTAYVLAVSCTREELEKQVTEEKFSDIIICAYNAAELSSVLLGHSTKQLSQLEMPNDFLKINQLKITSLTSESTNKVTHGEILTCIDNNAFLVKSLKFNQDKEDRECLQKQINSLTGESIAQNCMKGHLPVVKLLIHYGADVTQQNMRGQTPSSLTSDTIIKEPLLMAEKLITEARPDPLGQDGNPTTDFRFYDSEFAKYALRPK